jgi:cell fate regulator YaaT (PSP1 superfamily)
MRINEELLEIKVATPVKKTEMGRICTTRVEKNFVGKRERRRKLGGLKICGLILLRWILKR